MKLRAATTLDKDAIIEAGGVIWFSTSELERYLADKTFVKEKNRPLREQIFANNIDKQQNFRVEIEVPHADFLREMQRIYGPMFI